MVDLLLNLRQQHISFELKKKTHAGIGMLGVVLEGKLVHGQEKVAVSHSFSVRLLNRDFCSGEDEVF